MDESRVCGIAVMSKSGPQAILAGVTIDATGDGDVFASAGVPFHEGQRGIGLPFRMGNVDIKRVEQFRKENPDEYRSLMSSLKEAGGLAGTGHSAVHPGVIWWNNWGKVRSCLDVSDLTQAEIDARDAIKITAAFMKEHYPGFEDAFLMETAPQLGVRESRQLDGIYTVTESDVKSGSTFTDGVAQVAIGKSGTNFGVPYRCLLPVEKEGLLAAGRCISVDHYAQEPTRLIPACFSIGHAAGTAAAMSVLRGIGPRDLDAAALRRQLSEEKAYIV
jgi:hypothetical protein